MNKATHKVHPAAELFPMMNEAELKKLAEDIKKFGLRNPIVRDATGSILDGRNRLAACELVGATPRFQEYKGNEPVAFVISANIHRRHLDAKQKRELVAKLLKLYPEKSNRQIATVTKVDHKTVGVERRKKEGRGEIPHVAKRADTKGRNQPASKPRPPETSKEMLDSVAANGVARNDKSAWALAEFRQACNAYLPKMTAEHRQEAIRHCARFAKPTSSEPSPQAPEAVH
jgi:ParB-like chromosome segregation protein Spo0J